jgi:hypothetical protein
MSSSGRFQLRSWMFIYLGLIAAMVLAGPPSDSASVDPEPSRTLPLIGDSPLLRHDI